MISGDPTIRTFDPSSFAQQAVTHLCLDFQGKSERFNELPLRRCPSGIRSQIVSLPQNDFPPQILLR
jgi:hypothetical protein